MDTPNLAALRNYYSSVVDKMGFARRCSMNLPDGLTGMRIIDVGCRNGKGAMKLAGRAGSAGFVLGIDWLPERVDTAKNYARERRGAKERVREHGGKAEGCNRELSGTQGPASCEFRLGYPEALDAAGVREAEFDAAFVNCSMNLFHDISQAFTQIERCLKPGGLLIVDGVFADRSRNEHIVEQARKLDNSVQAAPAIDDFLQLLAELGFAHLAVEAGKPVSAATGFTDDTIVACADGREHVGFRTYMIQARKKLA